MAKKTGVPNEVNDGVAPRGRFGEKIHVFNKYRLFCRLFGKNNNKNLA
jgi:hypothetical protein